MLTTVQGSKAAEQVSGVLPVPSAPGSFLTGNETKFKRKKSNIELKLSREGSVELSRKLTKDVNAASGAPGKLPVELGAENRRVSRSRSNAKKNNTKSFLDLQDSILKTIKTN